MGFRISLRAKKTKKEGNIFMVWPAVKKSGFNPLTTALNSSPGVLILTCESQLQLITNIFQGK